MKIRAVVVAPELEVLINVIEDLVYRHGMGLWNVG